MKITDACSKLYRRSTTRFPYMEHYKYDYIRDPILKDSVSGKGEKEPRAVCVEEMILMLGCLKENDFDEKPCTKLINTFKTCVETTEANRRKQKEMRKSGVYESSDPSESGTKLPSMQVSKLLRRFPEPK